MCIHYTQLLIGVIIHGIRGTLYSIHVQAMRPFFTVSGRGRQGWRECIKVSDRAAQHKRTAACGQKQRIKQRVTR